ncbi:MAG: hypothetical protein JWO38_2336 [Gemmataceae bacterium]|nr:hypothetical protein [Gemmataceae bacterium]
MSELTLEALAERVASLERTISRLLSPDNEPLGTVGDEQSDEPEAVARWLAAFDAIPPATMTPDEIAAWQAARAAHLTASRC